MSSFQKAKKKKQRNTLSLKGTWTNVQKANRQINYIVPKYSFNEGTKMFLASINHECFK